MDTEFVDLDVVLSMYMDEYKNLRKKRMKDFKDRFQGYLARLARAHDEADQGMNWQEVHQIYQNVLSQ